MGHCLKFVDLVGVWGFGRVVETEKLATLFAGVVLIGAGILILERPDLIKYWVAIAFFLSGISYFVRVIRG